MGKGSKQKAVGDNFNDNFDNVFSPVITKVKCEECLREFDSIMVEIKNCIDHD